jgi:hypothetical protein
MIFFESVLELICLQSPLFHYQVNPQYSKLEHTQLNCKRIKVSDFVMFVFPFWRKPNQDCAIIDEDQWIIEIEMVS